ncbi:AraC family transcriptional regulator [Povalibacter sp.]|uniref:AraC family transcriptional regulator n=1 Tax=Povalibacter sp. TaxID=1962978 RepID=UPI002F424374
MNPIAKALWYIDSHYEQDITLEDIADCAGVSRFHLLRAFGAATGQSIMQYVRGRRLTQAAGQLAGGAADILTVALSVGYGSHEAFTRAFREQFGMTPEEVRNQRHIDNLPITEQLTMNAMTTVELEPPRFVDGKLLLVAGLHQHFDCVTSGGGIPGLWQRFGAYIGHISVQVGNVAYGVVYNTDEAGNMDYLCAVEVREFTGLPPGFTTLRIPERRYAVFTHTEHISTIRNTWNAIWNSWLPQSGHHCADAPFFERYPETFDPQSGNGGLELWVPLEQ